MTTSVKLGTAVTQNLSVTDTASTTYGNLDTFTLCGTRTFALSGSYSAFNSVSPATHALTSTVSLYTDLDADITTGVTETLTVCLQNYVSVVTCAVYTFTTVVNPCLIVTFN